MRNSMTYPGPIVIGYLCLLAFGCPSIAMAQTPAEATDDSTGDETTEARDTSSVPAAPSDSANKSDIAVPNVAKAPVPAAAPIAQPAPVVQAQSEPAASSSSAIGVQRVPDSGYPGAPSGSTHGVVDSLAHWDWKLGETAPKVRGIYGGSLWLTFHGLQWPYMPKKAGEPALMLGLSGYGWVDTGYEKIRTGKAGDSDVKYLVQQGRFVVRATPTYRIGDWFIQGQAELVANNDQTQTQAQGVVSADDVWMRAGKWDVFDIQAGRFEAWELYHLGMGLDLNTLERHGANNPFSVDNGRVPDFYGVTYAFYRPSGAGNVAAHLYLTDYLRIEALTRVGNDVGQNALGERGALVFDAGWLKIKGGGEYIRSYASQVAVLTHTVSRGGGGTVQFIFDPYVEFGANGGYALVDQWNNTGGVDEEGSYTIYSTGGFANLHLIGDLLAGTGVNYTHKADIHRDSTGAVGEFSQTQVFGALQYGLFHQLFLKAVVAYADARVAPSFAAINNIPPYTNKMVSARLRASFYF